jgi:hypothetical protein
MDGAEMKYLVYLFLILMLAGCTVSPLERPNCNEIVNLRAQIGKAISPDSFREWVSQTYHIPLETITVDVLENRQRHVVHWNEVSRVWSIVKWEEVVQVWYSATIEGLVVDDIRVAGGSVPASKVLACLGEPARYRARYERIVEGNQLSFDLLFPDQGILADGARFFRSDLRQPPPISDAFPLTGFIFTRPGTVEQILHDIYLSSFYQMLREYKPWPGKWEDIMVEIDPSIYW